MPVQTALTIQDLEPIGEDGTRRELIEGELIELPPPKLKYARIARRIFRLLDRLLPEEKFTVFPEAGYKVQRHDRTWIAPDVSIAFTETVIKADAEGYYEGSPALAIEVVSPSESAQDVLRKAELYLEGGAQEVWTVYPTEKRVVVRRAGIETLSLAETDKLDSVLGFSIPVRELFQI